jgi:hypothetical protein
MISFTKQYRIWSRLKKLAVYWLGEPNLTLTQRLVRTSLVWGVPMACLELIGIPFHYWAGVLIFILPATALGVVTYALLEHEFIVIRNKRRR